MKFIKIFAAVLAVSLVFLSLGGWMLFDFSRNFYLASSMCALIAAALIYIIVKQDDRIDRLEKRLAELEKTQKSEDK